MSEKCGKASPKVFINPTREFTLEQCRRRDTAGGEVDMAPVFVKHINALPVEELRLGEEALYTVGIIGILQNFD